MAIWTSEQNDYSNSESPCLPIDSHQISPKSDLPFGSRSRLNIYKMATMAAIFDIGTE